MVRREPPQTAEGWYALHDLRTVDWAAWTDAPERVRERALSEAVDHLQSAEAVDDAAEGDSALFAITGHGADLLIVHLRPTLADVELLERQFEQTEFARFTEQTDSYVSVTEASGYSERAREFFDGEVDDDSGLAQYIRSRLHPEIPDHEHVSFYPMSKRRTADQNWYDLPFEERAEHMLSHADIGRDYAGKVQQMITGSVGMDDWEWGVTLWADDLTDVKDLLYEMRFDPSTSKFAEFGPFYVGRRFPPTDLDAYLAGDRVPTGDESATDDETATSDATASETAPGSAASGATSNGHAGPGSGTGDSDGGATATDAHETTTASAGAKSSDAAGAKPSDGTGPNPGGGSGTSDGAESSDDAESSGDGADTRNSGGSSSSGGPPAAVQSEPDGDAAAEVDEMDRRLATFGVYPADYDDGDYGLVCYADAAAEDLVDEVDGLRENFDHYDTHVLTSVRANDGQAAIVSVWANERAASTALGFLTDVDAVTRSARGPLGDGGDASGDTSEADPVESSTAEDAAADVRSELADEGVYAGQPHGEDVYALVLYSRADAEVLAEEVDDLRDGFDRYDTHVKTAVYRDSDAVSDADSGADSDAETAAVVSLWETESAAEKAAGFLTDLPDVVGRPADRDGFGTMGMFYTVKPDYREEFVETFDAVGAQLDGMDGHRETALLVNRDDENDMFIASRWDAKEDAMAFFRSEAFRDTVEWGREVLADQPRHVFLA